MSQLSPTTIRPTDVLRSLREHRLRWIAPTIAITVLAALFALLRPASWEAAQALMVRDEAGGGTERRPGKFTRFEDMKTAQETILELAKNRGVLAQALAEIGPPATCADPQAWPSATEVENLQNTVKITPPKGAEFGKTEVFYLKVQDADQGRAIDLATAVCRQLQARFEELRKTKAQSVIDELVKTVDLAQADLNESTVELTLLERSVGADLAELRLLSEMPSGESTLRRSASDLDIELRTQRAAQSSNEELLKLLKAAQVDPGRLLASPSRLLESQPGLKRLKEGLLDAQIRTAQLLGTMSSEHPQVKSAKNAELEVGIHLHNELAIAIKGLEVDRRLSAERIGILEKQKQNFAQRLSRLAGLRAKYSNLLASTRNRSEIVKTAQLDLSEARASQAAAHTASLISLIDRPDAGTRPAGPGRSMIVLAGMAGGLLTGLGLVLLTVQPRTVVTTAGHEQPQAAENGSPLAPAAALKPTGLTMKQALQKVTGSAAAYN